MGKAAHLAYGVVSRYLVPSCFITLSLLTATAQEPAGDSESPAKLEINLNARGAASVSLRVFDHHLTSPLTPLVSQLLGCRLEDVKDRTADDDRLFSARCAAAFRKKGLLVGGEIKLAPVLGVLRQAGVNRLAVVIRHPHTGFARLTDSGWTIDPTAQSVEYSKSLETNAAPPRVRLAFGYRIINFLPISLLLFPIGLTMIMRWAALRARNTDPVVVWFTYWRLFGWILTGAWLLWMQGSTVLDCTALARFLVNNSSWSLLLQVAFYLVPPILVQFICTVASGAVLARVSGEHWILPVSLKHAFWHEPVTIWPLLCLLAGVASLTLFDEWVLGAACLAAAYLSYVALTWIWLRFQGLTRYTLPAGDLRSRILELAQKAGVKLKEVYVLPAAEGRLAAPLMVRRRRLFLSDALFRALRKNEVEAVLAREFTHVRSYHRAIVLCIAVLALPLAYRLSHLPALAAIPWAVRGPLLIWITPVLLYLLWRRFERVAETQSAAITGNADALLTALPAITRFNVLALYWRKFERRFIPNRSARDWRQPLETAEPAPARQVLVPAPSHADGRLVSTD
jgi:Zn-dependent protease with chaperone function